MTPSYALSYKEFCATMDYNKVDDSNIKDKPNAIIEIMGEQDLLIFPFWFKEPHFNVLRLMFDDVDEPLHVRLFGDPINDKREYIPVVPMNENQGRQIVQFIKRNSEAKSFIVHCAAGISRSAGVALFINEYFGGDWNFFKQNNPHTKPNLRIYKMLKSINKSI